MNYRYITIVGLWVAALGVSRAERPNPSPSEVVQTEARRDINQRDFYKIKVTLEDSDKEVTSFVAYCSEDANTKKLYCTGSLLHGDFGYWRLNLEAPLRDNLPDADIEIDIEDLKSFTKDSSGSITPMSIFSTRIQSSGPGSYLIGQVQGMTIKVEISKAERTTQAPTRAPQAESIR